MKTKAVRLYGKYDLRLEEFDLPEIKDNEILAKVHSDSICMSSYKAAKQGKDHKRVPEDVADNPIIIGHELCGEIVEVGDKWKSDFEAGDIFTIQPALNYKGSLDAPGYSYEYFGGDATYVVIPNEVMGQGCLLKYDSDVYYYGSLAEPMSCIVGAFHASFHIPQGTYDHKMGIVENGNMAILAGAGPMGFGAIDYAIHCDRKPRLLVVTDIDEARLKRAENIYSYTEAAKNGIDLYYINTADPKSEERIMALSRGHGYDDVFVMAPVAPVVEQADRLLARDGCINFFAGPTTSDFQAKLNLYNVHYASTHIIGTSGGNTDDMREAVDMMAKGTVRPSAMITHVGGLDSVVDTTLHLPEIAGGKKLIYNQIKMPLTAIDDFEEKGKKDELFKNLDRIVKENGGFWCAEAEKYLLDNTESID